MNLLHDWPTVKNIVAEGFGKEDSSPRRYWMNALLPFKQQDGNRIPINLKEYLELVDWGGREVRRNKRGSIPASAPPILMRLKMDAAPVLDYLAKDDLPGFGALGPVSMLKAFA